MDKITLTQEQYFIISNHERLEVIFGLLDELVDGESYGIPDDEYTKVCETIKNWSNNTGQKIDINASDNINENIG